MTHHIVTNPAPPGSPEHARMVTASKIPTILGLSPFQTPGELWMIMAGLTEPEQLEGDHLAWGHVGELSLAQWWAYKNPGWQLNAGGEIAYEDTSLPFPNQATLDRRARRGRARHIIECKTSDWTQMWSDTESLPAHVATQTLSQQGISGIHRASVVAQLKSTVPTIYPVEWDPDLWVGVVDEVAAFHRSIGEHEPPMPDPALIDALKNAVVHAPADGEVDAPDDLVDEFRRTAAALAEAESDHEQSKQALLEALGDNRKMLHAGKTLISAREGRFSTRNLPDDAKHLLDDPDVTTPKVDPKKFAAKYPDIAAAATSDASHTFYERAIA